MKNIHQHEWKAEVTDNPLPVLVAFGAPRCHWCVQQKPILDALEPKYADRVCLASVNTDQEGQLSRTNRIRGIPTLIAFHHGIEVERRVGFQNATQLEALLNTLAVRNIEMASFSTLPEEAP